MSSRPLTIFETEAKFRQMLLEAGMPFDKLELEKAWNVFREFCKFPIETGSDGILIQWGINDDWQEIDGSYVIVGEEYYFSFLRQVNDADEEFEQIKCTLYYPVDETLRLLGTANEWRFENENHPETVESFLARHEVGQVFQTLKAYKPIRSLAQQQNTG